jgi:protein translocase SEC61 complex gamma subunit
MGIRSWLSQASKTLKLATKPGRDELWLSIKVTFLGMGVIGLIGYLIKLVSSVLNPGAA